VPANLAHRYAQGIQRDDLFIQTHQAGLVFGNQLRLKDTMAHKATVVVASLRPIFLKTQSTPG
jgi:hypothetical protein